MRLLVLLSSISVLAACSRVAATTEADDAAAEEVSASDADSGVGDEDSAFDAHDAAVDTDVVHPWELTPNLCASADGGVDAGAFDGGALDATPDAAPSGAAWHGPIGPPGTHGTVAVSGCRWFAPFGTGVARSDDGGGTFRLIKSGGIGPSRSAVIVRDKVCVAAEGVWCAPVDGGEFVRMDGYFTPALIAATTSGALFVSPSGPGPLRRSLDGATWTEVASYSPKFLHAFGENVSFADETGKGFKWSSDAGNTWSSATVGTTLLGGLRVGTRLVALDFDGVKVSADEGKTWTSVVSARLQRIAARESMIIATGINVVARSLDAGVTWKVFAVDLPSSSGDPTFDSSGGVLVPVERGLFRSGDSGRTFARLGAVVPTDTRKVAVRVEGSTKTIYALDSSGWLSRSDDGATWTRLASGIGTFEFAGSALVVGGASGLRRSTDNGATFVVTSDEPLHGYAHPPVSVAFGDAVLMTDGRIFKRSADAGLTWSDVTTIVTPVEQFAVDRAGRMFAATLASTPSGTNGAIYFTDDGGLNWRTPSDLYTRPSDYGARAVAVTGDGSVYLITQYGRYMRSTNRGDTWALFEAPGLPGAAVDSFYPLGVGPLGELIVTSSDPMTLAYIVRHALPDGSFGDFSNGLPTTRVFSFARDASGSTLATTPVGIFRAGP